MPKMTPFLWYDGNVAEAMELYRAVFPGSKVLNTMPGPNGSLMSATFELDGQRFIAFNGGPHLKLTPAVSMLVELRDPGRSGRAVGQADRGRRREPVRLAGRPVRALVADHPVDPAEAAG